MSEGVSHRQIHLPPGIVASLVERKAEVDPQRPDDRAVAGAATDAVQHGVERNAAALPGHLARVEEPGDVDGLGDGMPQLARELDQRAAADGLVAVDEVLALGVALRRGEERARQGTDPVACVAADGADAAGVEALVERDLHAAVDGLHAPEAEPARGAELLQEGAVEAPLADEPQEEDVAPDPHWVDAETPDLAARGIHQVVGAVPVHAEAESGYDGARWTALVLVWSAEGEPDRGLHVAEQVERGPVEGVGGQAGCDVPFETRERLRLQEVVGRLDGLLLEEDEPDTAGLAREMWLEEVSGDGAIQLRDARRDTELPGAPEEVVVPPARDTPDALLGVVPHPELHLVALDLRELDVHGDGVATGVVLDQPDTAEEVEGIDVLARLLEQALLERSALLEA